MANAVIYARYSSHSQREESIEDQVRVCRKAAEDAGDRIVGVYADRARSGRGVSNRTEFLRMIDDAKDGHWTKLYIYKQDRFARDRYDAAFYKRKLRDAGVKVVPVMEPTPEGPEGIIVETLMEGLAEYYSANLSQNVKRGMEGNALKCKHNGCQLYGYDLGTDGYYHANPDEAPIVRRAFEMSAAGMDTGEIERAFANLRTRAGARWTKGRISGLLKNEKYAGTYIFKGHRVENGMEAIVGRDTWERANAGLGKRHRREHRYELSGLLFDAKGRRFAGVSAKGRSKVYHYYRVTETGESYPQRDVENAVYETVAAFLESDADMREAIAEAVAAEVERSSAADHDEAESMRSRIAELDREADNLINLAAKVGASERITERLKSIEEERLSLQSELNEVERSVPSIDREAMLAFMDLIIAGEAPGPIVAAFVSRVMIDGDDMTVEFNVSERNGSRQLSAGPYTTNRPDEPAGSEPKRAIRINSHWLACNNSIQTLAVSVFPWGFVLVRRHWHG